MARTPDKRAGSTKNHPEDQKPQNIDVERILELTKKAVLLESERDSLKSEITNLQTEIDSYREKLDKIGDKRKAEYKDINNKLNLAIVAITAKQKVELPQKNADLKETKEKLNNVANISASKNLPQRDDNARKNQEKVEKENEKSKKIKELAEKFNADPGSLNDEEKELVNQNMEAFRKELKKSKAYQLDVEDFRKKLAKAEFEGRDLTLEERVEKDLLFTDPTEKQKVEDLKLEMQNGHNQKSDIAQKLAKGTALTAFEKDYYKKNKSSIDARVPEFAEVEDENKQAVIDKISTIIAEGRTLSSAQQMQLRKYQTEILEAVGPKIDKIANAKNIRIEIAEAELEGRALTTEQNVFLLLPGERAEIDAQKTNIGNHRNKLDSLARELAAGIQITDPADKDFYEANKAVIDAKIPAAKEAKLKQDKQNIIDKLVSGTVLTAEESAFEKDHHGEIDGKVMEALRSKLADLQTNGGNPNDINAVRNAIESRIRKSKKTMEEYEPLIKRFKETNEQIIKLQAKSKLSAGEQELLNNLKQEKEQIYNGLDALGPSGRGFADLELARNDLAKASKEFEGTFVKKFHGAKIWGVVAGMFGSKWSALKESDRTPAALEKMRNAQQSYDKVREGLMNVFIEEEYSVREAFGQDLKNLGAQDKREVEAFLNNISKQFITSEYEKLNDTKNVLEGTVRGSAMRRFGEWYSKGGFYKNVKNPVLRKVLNRVTSGTILSAGLFMVPGVGAGAALGTYLGYRATRAAVSGTVGESMAAGVARIYGGKLNKKGEFEKFAKVRDADFEASRQAYVNEMMQRLGQEEKPLMTSSTMQKLNGEHAKAVSNYMNSQGNARRAEMWTRLLTGGAMAYSMTHLLPNPTASYIPGPSHDNVPSPASAAGSGFRLEGDFVDASSKGSIQTFMNLKEKMIEHYANNSAFAGLSHNQIAEKLLATGKFDDLTGDIMRSNSLDDFMKTAQDHGFWKPKGWGNPNIDSATIPKGSIVGMETDPQGNMQFYMELPDGKHIPLDDNFQEALDQHIKGVDIINTDRSSGFRAGGSNVEQFAGSEKPPVEVQDLDSGPAPETYADTASGAEEVIRKVTTAAGPETVSTNSIYSALEANYMKAWNLVHGEYFKGNPMDLNSPHAIYKSLIENGHSVHVQGDGITPMQTPDLTKIDTGHATAFVIDGKQYFLESYTNTPAGGKILERDLILGVDANGRNITIDDYHKFQNLDHNKMVDEPYQQYLKDQAEMKAYRAGEAANNSQDAASGSTINSEVFNKSVTEQSDKWVDEAFGKTNIFGKHTMGANTDAWNNLKNDNAAEFMKSNAGRDDVYTSKDADFQDILSSEAKKFGLNPEPGESVEQFTKRLAAAEVRSARSR